MNSMETLELLKQGNQRFVNHQLVNITKEILDLSHTNREQNPFAIIVGCSDARVPTEMIFDTRL